MLKPLLGAIAVALACALVVAGCGGDSASGDKGSGDSGDTASRASQGASTISKSEFVQGADAICAKGRKQVEAEYAAYLERENIKEVGDAGESPAETKERQAEVIETIAIPALNKQQEEMVALGLPKGEEAQAQEYFDTSEKAIEEAERDPASFFTSAPKAFADADELAGKLGFKVCGASR